MTVAALISGGVDSAVAVHKLVEQGVDTHLFYIRIGRDDGSDGCSAEEDIEMCRLIARRYNLPLDIAPLHQEYWDTVMDYTLRAVKAGLTPHPDMMCNKMIKLGYFEQRWGRHFDLTATGHYATTRVVDGVKHLATAADPVKDQTDFLAQISYQQLEHVAFPIGAMTKAEVRREAAQAKLPNAFRKDSQGICFLGKINYNDFIRRHLGEKPGSIIEIETGRKLGQHRGYWFHTIGQRHGLGLGGGPWYVVNKNVADNVVYVSRGYDCEKQYGRTIHIEQTHFIAGDPWPGAAQPVDITFKCRHTPEFTPAKLIPLAPGEYMIESSQKVQGIAPGQFAVIYDAQSQICHGSGLITGQKPKS